MTVLDGAHIRFHEDRVNIGACSDGCAFIQLPKAWPIGVAGPTGCVFTPGHRRWWTLSMATSIAPSSATLHNGQHDLPWPAGEDSGAKPHWRHLGLAHAPPGRRRRQPMVGGRQLGQLRMCLATHGSRGGWSELSLGHHHCPKRQWWRRPRPTWPGWAKASRPHRRLGHRARGSRSVA